MTADRVLPIHPAGSLVHPAKAVVAEALRPGDSTQDHYQGSQRHSQSTTAVAIAPRSRFALRYHSAATEPASQLDPLEPAAPAVQTVEHPAEPENQWLEIQWLEIQQLETQWLDCLLDGNHRESPSPPGPG